MAYQFYLGGSAATNYADFISKLKTFLTANSALVTAGQNWTVLEDAGTTICLRAPGLAGTDQIFINLTRKINSGAPYYNLGINGADGYLAAQPADLQPNPSQRHFMHLWDQPMDCWFFANGRRAVVVAKVNNTYQSAYFGFWLPDGTPAEMPYPVYIGASSALDTVNWTSVSPDVRCFFDPKSAQLRHMDGAWLDVTNYYDSSGVDNPVLITNVFPWMNRNNFLGVDDWRESPGGDYPLVPAELCSTYSGGNNYGTLDGVYFVPGFNQASENIVQWNSFDHLVFQNNFRTATHNFCAIRKE